MPPTPKSQAPTKQVSRPFTSLLLFSFLLPLFALLLAYLSFLPNPNYESRLSTLLPVQPSVGQPKALILTAHPDDEVMFFSPTILSLVKDGWDVKGLCLSTGQIASHYYPFHL